MVLIDSSSLVVAFCSAILTDIVAQTPIPPVTGSADPVEGEEILGVFFPASFPSNLTVCVKNAVFVVSWSMNR